MIYKIIFIISTAFVVDTYGYQRTPCKIITFDYKNFEKDYIINEGLTRPFHMSYSAKTNTLMFHEDTEILKNTKTYTVDLNTKQVTEIESLNHAVGSVVDENDNFIIATNDGLYKYVPSTKTLTTYGLQAYSFYNIYKYNNKFYFIDYPKRDLYEIKNGVANSLIKGNNIETFALDSQENFVYGNATGLFYGNLRTGSVDYIVESDNLPFDGVVVNPGNEIVFVFSHYGVFKIKRDSGELKRISTKAMFDLIFDKNGDVIYSDEEHIVRLKLTNRTC